MKEHLKASNHEGDELSDPCQHRRSIGKLLYVTLTKLDNSFSANRLRKFMGKPRLPHLQDAHMVLKYLKPTPGQGLFFSASSTLHLKSYCDSDWAGCPDTRRFITYICVFLGDSLISWKSKKQHTASWSFADVDYRTMATVVSEIVWLIALLKDFSAQHTQRFCIVISNL